MSKLYLKMYLRFTTDAIKKFEHMSEMKVFLAILEDCQKDTMQWSSFKSKRKDISMHLGISEITVNRAINRLAKFGFIERISKGIYKVNTDYFEFG